MVAVIGPSPSTALGVYNATPPTGADQQAMPLQVDSAGRLITTGGGSGGVTAANITQVGGVSVNPTVASYGLLPVGGWSLKAPLAVTTTAVTYATGQNIGGLLTVTNVAPVADERFILQEVTVNCKSTQTTQLDVIFFSANPSNSTITNGSALVIATADYALITEVVHITDWTPLNSASFAQADNLARLMAPTSGTTSTYACIVARGSLTSGTTSEITLNLKTASV